MLLKIQDVSINQFMGWPSTYENLVEKNETIKDISFFIKRIKSAHKRSLHAAKSQLGNISSDKKYLKSKKQGSDFPVAKYRRNLSKYSLGFYLDRYYLIVDNRHPLFYQAIDKSGAIKEIPKSKMQAITLDRISGYSIEILKGFESLFLKYKLAIIEGKISALRVPMCHKSSRMKKHLEKERAKATAKANKRARKLNKRILSNPTKLTIQSV